MGKLDLQQEIIIQKPRCSAAGVGAGAGDGRAQGTLVCILIPLEPFGDRGE